MQDMEERISFFLDSLESGTDPFLERIYEEAVDDEVPVIRRGMISFLQVMVKMAKPARILEVGTAVGFSALVMAQAMPETCTITTIERDPDRALKARENIGSSAYSDRIRVLEGDAADLLGGLEGAYDLVFMDAAKGQYLNFLPDVLRLMSPGGVLITDNVLREGDVLESHYAVARRDRTIHKRMRAYLLELKRNEQLDTTILAFADGVALSRKKDERITLTDEET